MCLIVQRITQRTQLQTDHREERRTEINRMEREEVANHRREMEIGHLHLQIAEAQRHFPAAPVAHPEPPAELEDSTVDTGTGGRYLKACL